MRARVSPAFSAGRPFLPAPPDSNALHLCCLPQAAAQQQPPAASSEGGTNWAGVAAAGLVVAGLSAAVYFAPEDALKGAGPVPSRVRLQRPGMHLSGHGWLAPRKCAADPRQLQRPCLSALPPLPSPAVHHACFARGPPAALAHQPPCPCRFPLSCSRRLRCRSRPPGPAAPSPSARRRRRCSRRLWRPRRRRPPQWHRPPRCRWHPSLPLWPPPRWRLLPRRRRLPNLPRWRLLR